MRFEYTDGCNKDFIELCHGLDNFLNELVGGEENRAEYIPYNKLDDIHDVFLCMITIFLLEVQVLKNMMMNVRK